MTEAALLISQTSPDCCKYELIRDGRRIFITRCYAHEQGHAGARARMAAWATRHKVTVATMERVKQPA